MRSVTRPGVAVHIDSRPTRGIEGMGHVRRETMRAGLAAGTSHLHLCDFDRAIHWVAHYPEELSVVVEAVGACDLLMLGRTAGLGDPSALPDRDRGDL